MNSYNIKRIPSIKFLGVLLDENLSWKDHIKYTENNLCKTRVMMIPQCTFFEAYVIGDVKG